MTAEERHRRSVLRRLKAYGLVANGYRFKDVAAYFGVTRERGQQLFAGGMLQMYYFYERFPSRATRTLPRIWFRLRAEQEQRRWRTDRCTS